MSQSTSPQASEHSITVPTDAYGRVSEAEVAKLFSRMVNTMSAEGAEFAQLLANDHRTLVQKSAATFLTFFVALANDADHGYVDARNAQSADLAQKIRDLLVAEGTYIRDGVVRLAFV